MSASTDRLPALDGLRGAAALVVVVHHAALLVPVLAGAYFHGAIPASLGWLVYSPLHLLWDGSGPVFVFFILSGLVVPLPALRSRGFSWADYFPRRLVRLYVPVVASLVIAYALILLVPRRYGDGSSAWTEWHAVSASLEQFLRESVLVAGVGPANSPLWSLQWEVVFSLLLPLYVLLGRWSARRPLPVAVVCVVLVGVGGLVQVPALTYLPMFAIGVLFAVTLSRIAEWDTRLRASGGKRRVVALLAGLSVAGLSWRWLTTPLFGDSAYPWSFAPTVLGAGAVLLLVLISPRVQRALTHRAARAAGMLSFSLYLVHDPILVTTAQFFPTSLAWLAAICGVVISIAVAVVFFRLVERPSHLLARVAGRSAARITGRLSGRTASTDRPAVRLVAPVLPGMSIGRSDRG